MADEPQQLPDHLSLDPRSPYFNEDVLSQGVGIRFNGRKDQRRGILRLRGWIRVAAGRSRDRYGNPMTIKLKGTVEPYIQNPDQLSGEDGVASEG